jgi:hypothetical protein
MKIIFILMAFFSQNLWAMPKSVEVWFISIDRTVFLDHLENKIKYSKLTANARLQCQPMGDYCFDPQVGMYKMGENQKIEEAIDYQELDKKEQYKFLEPAKSIEREMINCERGSFFDIFCGKAQKAGPKDKAKLELWIDTSSSMKQVDYVGFEKKCARELLLENLNQSCGFGQQMQVYAFDTSRKEMGAMDQACINVGLNEPKRLMQDIERSNANHLIIITDIFEASVEFINFIENTARGKVIGIDKPMYAKDMQREIKRIKSLCSKN